MWTYERAYPTLLAFDRLCYPLLPYVYSLAWVPGTPMTL